jgi:hypothetical protein
MKIYVIQGLNRVRQVEAEVDGDVARISLPFGAYKVVKKPNWCATLQEADARVFDIRERRIKSLKRQLRGLTK